MVDINRRDFLTQAGLGLVGLLVGCTSKYYPQDVLRGNHLGTDKTYEGQHWLERIEYPNKVLYDVFAESSAEKGFSLSIAGSGTSYFDAETSRGNRVVSDRYVLEKRTTEVVYVKHPEKEGLERVANLDPLLRNRTSKEPKLKLVKDGKGYVLKQKGSEGWVGIKWYDSVTINKQEYLLLEVLEGHTKNGLDYWHIPVDGVDFKIGSVGEIITINKEHGIYRPIKNPDLGKETETSEGSEKPKDGWEKKIK